MWDCDKYPAMTKEQRQLFETAKQTFGGGNGKVKGGQGEEGGDKWVGRGARRWTGR